MDLESQDLLRAPHWPPCLREPACLSLNFAEFLGEILLFLLSCYTMSNSAPPWTAACQAPLSCTIYLSLLRFVSIELVMLSNHLMLHSAQSTFTHLPFLFDHPHGHWHGRAEMPPVWPMWAGPQPQVKWTPSQDHASWGLGANCGQREH